MIFTGFHGLYILLEITCYNYRKYIYFSASKLFNQCKMTPPPPLFMTSPQYLLVTRWVIHRIRIQNSVVGGQYSTGSIFNMSGLSKIRKNVFAKLLKNDPGYIFNDSRSQFSTEKKHPGFNIQRWKMNSGSIINPVQNTSLHRRWIHPWTKQYLCSPLKSVEEGMPRLSLPLLVCTMSLMYDVLHFWKLRGGGSHLI